MAQKKGLLFRPEYQWPGGKKVKPFHTMPSWWRRFFFQILTPREITVYDYFLSRLNPEGVAWPSPEQIASDMAYKDVDAIRKATRKLVDLGFLIGPSDEERIEYKLGKMPIYQRPCPAYTIKKLLETGTVNGALYPTSNKVRSQHDEDADSVVKSGIAATLADFPELAQAYEFAAGDESEGSVERLTLILSSCLDEVLTKMTESKPGREKKPRKPMDPDVIDKLPTSVQEVLKLSRDAGIKWLLGASTASTRRKATSRKTGRRKKTSG